MDKAHSGVLRLFTCGEVSQAFVLGHLDIVKACLGAALGCFDLVYELQGCSIAGTGSTDVGRGGGDESEALRVLGAYSLELGETIVQVSLIVSSSRDCTTSGY